MNYEMKLLKIKLIIIIIIILIIASIIQIINSKIQMIRGSDLNLQRKMNFRIILIININFFFFFFFLKKKKLQFIKLIKCLFIK